MLSGKLPALQSRKRNTVLRSLSSFVNCQDLAGDERFVGENMRARRVGRKFGVEFAVIIKVPAKSDGLSIGCSHRRKCHLDKILAEAYLILDHSSYSEWCG